LNKQQLKSQKSTTSEKLSVHSTGKLSNYIYT